MKRRKRASANYYAFHSEATEPMLLNITSPMPRFALPRESWFTRAMRGIGTFFAAIIKKINQLLALGLAVLLLLLFIRFILYFFHFSIEGSSLQPLFSYWVFFLSAPFVAPFENLAPSLPYYGYSIDTSTLIAILAYALGVAFVRQFLKILVTH
ncbi:MAG TPA: YggT family protein [Ktedonobacteraceae bacterium]